MWTVSCPVGHSLSTNRPTALPHRSHLPCKTRSPPLTLPVILSLLVVPRQWPHQTEFKITSRCSEGIAAQIVQPPKFLNFNCYHELLFLPSEIQLHKLLLLYFLTQAKNNSGHLSAVFREYSWWMLRSKGVLGNYLLAVKYGVSEFTRPSSQSPGRGIWRNGNMMKWYELSKLSPTLWSGVSLLSSELVKKPWHQ